jgi:hypothetical protein
VVSEEHITSIFYPEDGEDTFDRNVGKYLPETFYGIKTLNTTIHQGIDG